MRFNETAQAYNTAIKKFPANFAASILGFKERPYFAATAGSDKPPSVNFNFAPSPAPAR